VVNITIRNIPTAVWDEVTRRAHLRGQSGEEFVGALLRGLTPRRDKTEVLRRIDERRANLPDIDIASLIQRRNGGRY
jgi:hypothetical protein